MSNESIAYHTAINILISRHKEEFNEIYDKMLKDAEKYGGILK